MPTTPGTNWRRNVFLGGCAAVVSGLVGLVPAFGQTLDMGASPAASPPATRQPGDLDMDVNPSAPVAAPAIAKPGIRAISGDNVQDGIVQVNPGASVAQTAPVQTAPVQTAPLQIAPPAPPVLTVAPAPPPVPTPPPVQTTTLTQPNSEPPAGGSAPAPAEQPVSLDHPTVVDTAVLKAGDTTVTLFGIDGVGGEAAQDLQGFLASTGDHLTCQAQTSAGFVCLLADGTDVAQAALVNGAARVKDDAPEAYREQQAAAQAARRGIWASLPPPPVTIQHPVVQDTATLTAGGQTYALDGVRGLGPPYAAQMQGYIGSNGDSLTCNPQSAAGEYICVLGDGTDIAKVALVNGAAVVAADAPDAYRLQQGEALNNRRGIWANPPPNLMVAEAPAADVAEYALVAGDDGSDGITYVGGVPEAVIDGAAVFLVFGGAAGWGYYDHYHHWHDAPGRYRAHMEHYHPYGHGLRGYREAAAHPGGMHPAGMHTESMHPGAMHPEAERSYGHPAGVAGHEMHPGGVAGHPGGGFGAAQHPSSSFAGRPTAARTGFVHPGPSAGGFHPGGGGAAPHAVHAASGGGSGKKK
jgi:endonuclease YncB( thermonuclease family)